jgi:HEAT repeat protein
MTGIQALARSKEPADRVDAAANLSPPTDDAHVDLLRTLSTDPHESVSHAAIQALGQGDDPRLVEPLIAAAFESDLPESARHAALLALSRHALPERIPQALLLCAHPSAVIRKGALHALAAWNTTYGHAFIVAALEDNATIDTAAGVLARLGATWSAPTLLASLDRPELSATQRHRVISAIGSLGNPNAIGPLLNRLPGATGAESVSIARALGAIGAPSAIPTLIGLLESPDPTLQDAALGGLEGITGERLGRDPSGWRAWAQARMPSPIGDNSRKRRPLNQRSTLGAERTP